MCVFLKLACHHFILPNRKCLTCRINFEFKAGLEVGLDHGQNIFEETGGPPLKGFHFKIKN